MQYGITHPTLPKSVTDDQRLFIYPPLALTNGQIKFQFNKFILLYLYYKNSVENQLKFCDRLSGKD